jgi:ABC-2 type transport system permease protein
VCSAFAVSAALTAVSMAASAMTDRKAFAAIGVVLAVLVLPSLAGALVDGAELSPYWRTIDIFSMPFELVYRIYGQLGNFPEVATWAVVASNVVVTALGFAVVAWRYRTLVVAR